MKRGLKDLAAEAATRQRDVENLSYHLDFDRFDHLRRFRNLRHRQAFGYVVALAAGALLFGQLVGGWLLSIPLAVAVAIGAWILSEQRLQAALRARFNAHKGVLKAEVTRELGYSEPVIDAIRRLPDALSGRRAVGLAPGISRLRQLVHDGVAAHATLREVLTDDDAPDWVNEQHGLLDAAERSTIELLERATMLFGILNTEAHSHELSRASLTRLEALVAAVVRAATTCMQLAALTDAQRAQALTAESENLRDAVRAFSEAMAP